MHPLFYFGMLLAAAKWYFEKIFGLQLVTEKSGRVSLNVTWANLLAAYKQVFLTAFIIIPWVIDVMPKAMLISSEVVWFSCFPECEFPGSAISPLPSALLLNIAASEPSPVISSICQSFRQVVLSGTWADRSQVTSLCLAKCLSSVPSHFCVAPEVTVVPVLLPVLSTGIHTGISATC